MQFGSNSASEFMKVHVRSKKSAKKSKNSKREKDSSNQSKAKKNSRAFSVTNVVSAKKNIQRNLDKAQQKEVVPLKSKEEDLPPPTVVVVMGPKGCGKSTLIRSLVKLYSGQNISDVLGPINTVAGARKRITFFECPTDIYSMTDLSKVADLVLILIDASYGYEMETFEFLNMLQIHGFPKVIGILTHLDGFKSAKSLQTVRKAIKHRFWTEIFKGAKMFDFIGVINNKYRKHEVKRLALTISRVKYRPLIWRNSHPYIIADRIEDVTPASNSLGGSERTGERDITFYGYVRGSHLKLSTKLHLIGAGDFDIHSISALSDPCPMHNSASAASEGRLAKRKKETLLYAPMANIGRLSVDQDNMYIELKQINYSKREDIFVSDQNCIDFAQEPNNSDTTGSSPLKLVRSLQEVREGVDIQTRKSSLALFSDDLTEYKHFDTQNSLTEAIPSPILEAATNVQSSTMSSNYETNKLPPLLPIGASQNNIMNAIYGNYWSLDTFETIQSKETENTKQADDSDMFFTSLNDKNSKSYHLSVNSLNYINSSRTFNKQTKNAKFLAPRPISDICYCFKTRFAAGNFLRKQDMSGDDSINEVDDNSSTFGYFEDLETSSKNKELESIEIEAENERLDEQIRLSNAKKKVSFTEKLRDSKNEDEKCDDETEFEEMHLVEEASRRKLQQSERNFKEFGQEGEVVRQRFEGFRQGLYIRVLIKGVPEEFLSNFRPTCPVILGGLLPTESSLGYLTARVKRHRWHKRVLKSNDPLIFSIGWRRFQSIPIFTTTDPNDRERYLKYTPEHMHCTASFYGPFVAPNTGILAFQAPSSGVANFRISLTGTSLEQRTLPDIVKKLKLVGTPTKIYKNTAYISGMFTSSIEVAKYEHAKIKTVSGIRGSIKKAVYDKNSMESKTNDGKSLAKLTPGTFRATFEDKILMSDIVICRLWVNVEPKQLYNPILSSLAPSTSTELMRSTAQLRKALQIPQEVNKDSVYKPIERQEREFRKLSIPVKLKSSLPYASRTKILNNSNPNSYVNRRAVLLEPEEKKSRALIQTLNTIKKDKEKNRAASQENRLKEKNKKRERDAKRFDDAAHNEKKRKYKEKGLEQERRLKKTKESR